MTQVTTNHPRGGWREEEIEMLFEAVREATEAGRPLRNVFSDVGSRLSRKPNSIRNFYYARVREMPELAPRQTPFRAFTDDELHWLLRSVLMGRGQGESVRACVMRLAGGDRAGMLRYQNKYRSVLKNRPELLLSVAEELRMEGLPCPDAVIACRKYDRVPKEERALQELTRRMDDPCVSRMVEGLLELLRRTESAETAILRPDVWPMEMPDAQPALKPKVDPDAEPEEVVPYRKWAEARKEADRLRVEVDLLKMALEDARSAVCDETI